MRHAALTQTAPAHAGSDRKPILYAHPATSANRHGRWNLAVGGCSGDLRDASQIAIQNRHGIRTMLVDHTENEETFRFRPAATRVRPYETSGGSYAVPALAAQHFACRGALVRHSLGYPPETLIPASVRGGTVYGAARPYHATVAEQNRLRSDNANALCLRASDTRFRQKVESLRGISRLKTASMSPYVSSENKTVDRAILYCQLDGVHDCMTWIIRKSSGSV